MISFLYIWLCNGGGGWLGGYSIIMGLTVIPRHHIIQYVVQKSKKKSIFQTQISHLLSINL